MNAADLIGFEAEIAHRFNLGEIPHPVHLSGGNEEQLIEIFKGIDDDDWVCGSWRMHYQCLLKGVPPVELTRAIYDGRSIALCFPKYRIVSSAIVGGILPIALGIAWAIKRNGGTNKVHAFMGDMTALTAAASECANYALVHDLPLNFIIECNGLSVCTPIEAVWAGVRFASYSVRPKTTLYDYKLPWPHAGAGKRVQF